MLYAEAVYEPRFFEHIPGVGNVVAGALSRIYDPSKRCSIPSVWSGLAPTPVPRRSADWYTALTA